MANLTATERPVDELARRLFAAGGVEKIHINGSVVTVTLGGGQTGAGLGDVVRDLFLHYGDASPVPTEAPAEGTQDGAVKGPRLPRRGVGVDEAFPECRTEAVEQLIL